MNLRNKKNLTAKTLEVGRKRISFLDSRRDEIKEAITKQDIRDLVKNGAIIIKEKKGRKKIIKRKRNRGVGKVKKKINKRKQQYVKLTRKLRRYIYQLKKQGIISREEYLDLRKKIRNKDFKSKANLKRYLNESLKKEF